MRRFEVQLRSTLSAGEAFPGRDGDENCGGQGCTSELPCRREMRAAQAFAKIVRGWQKRENQKLDQPNVYGSTHCDGLYLFGGAENKNSASKLDMEFV